MNTKQQLANLISQLIPYAEALIQLRGDLGYLDSVDTSIAAAQDRIKNLAAQEATLKSSLATGRAELNSAQSRREEILGEANKRANELLEEAKATATAESDRVFNERQAALDELEVKTKESRAKLSSLQAAIAERTKEHQGVEASIAALTRRLVGKS